MRLLGALICVLIGATPVLAQEESHWGITGTFVPRWEFLDFLEDPMDRSIDMHGDDVRIGIVKGRQRGGDWGVSYVRRRVDDDSLLLQETPKCVSRDGQPDLCAGGTAHRMQRASLEGVQFHRFFPFGLIGGHVQIGAVVTVGAGRLRGDAEEIQEHLQVAVDPNTGAASLSITSQSQTIRARDVFDHTFLSKVVPIGGAEAAVAVLVAPGFKLRVSAGAAFPGFHTVAITAQYLFGAQ